MNTNPNARALLINAPCDHESWRDAFRAESGIELIHIRSLEQLHEELRSASLFALVGDSAQDIDVLTAMCTVTNALRRCPIVLLGDGDGRRLQRAQLAAQEVDIQISASLRGPFDGRRLARALSRLDSGAIEPTAEELRRALAEQQLTLHFQPKFDARGQGQRVVSLEALLRWEHPELGMLLPGRFLPLARASDLLLELTDFTLTEAIHQMSLWRGRRLDVTVAVNLDTELLQDRFFSDRLLSYLRQFDVPPERLMLELRESPEAGAREVYQDVLTMLRVEGVGLAVDDFGGGGSSLIELYRTPFTEVKLDPALIADAARSPKARAVVRSMIKLAHELSMTVCAESVESRAMLDFLAGAGCDLVQGNVLCEPRTLFELEPLLASQCATDADPKRASPAPASNLSSLVN